MLNFISTPFTVAPSMEGYGVILDVVPIKGEITPDSFLWPVKSEFEQSKRQFGSITVVEREGKTYIGMHCVFQEAAPSTLMFLDNGIWYTDNDANRLRALNKCLFCATQIPRKGEVTMPLVLTKEYKPAIKKHMTDIEYFVKYIEKYIPSELDVTIFYQEPKRMKSNKLKIEKLIDNAINDI